VKYAMTLLPAIIICSANLFSYLTSAILMFVMNRFGAAQTVFTKENKGWPLRLSPVSAVVFCISYLLSVLFRSDALGTVSIVAVNLLIILTPGFSMVGFKDVIRRIRDNTESGYSPFYLVALIFLIFINPIACMLLLAFFGVVVTFISVGRIRNSESM